MLKPVNRLVRRVVEAQEASATNYLARHENRTRSGATAGCRTCRVNVVTVCSVPARRR